SRRRHTRWPRDWSSDVCSSDLVQVGTRAADTRALRAEEFVPLVLDLAGLKSVTLIDDATVKPAPLPASAPLSSALAFAMWPLARSEERRVGKGWSARGWLCVAR